MVSQLTAQSSFHQALAELFEQARVSQYCFGGAIGFSEQLIEQLIDSIRLFFLARHNAVVSFGLRILDC